MKSNLATAIVTAIAVVGVGILLALVDRHVNKYLDATPNPRD